jgi:hypothetical protein
LEVRHAQDGFAVIYLLHLGNGRPRIRPDHSPSTFRPAGANHGEHTGTDRGRPRQRAGPKGQRHASSGNQARHRKLFQLSTDLKEYVDKNQGILSLDAAKKAEQIEKLAHGLKSKIKQSF